ncbi:Cysteine--tRNA ligase [Azospirillaceae bacterium]
MPLDLYNTLTRAKERFQPLTPDTVRLYVCGPTVYDFAHIGNARPVTVFDVLYRLLRHLYPHVVYVRNITDVDDKIIKAADQNKEPIDDLTRRTTNAYHADMDALNALRPDIEPRATSHIEEMVHLIERLIERDHAYVAEGHVLFHVPSMPTYGRLSRRNQDEMVAGARVEIAPYKRDPSDFVLWKPSEATQPGWSSPWGRGRPGWHIECSAMAEKHLGVPFDIHGGGLDLIFPHHENEIAQSVCAHNHPILAQFWVHNGFVTVEGEKMSKSLGNFRTVRELLQQGWDGEVIRLTLLQTHYRQPLDFTERGLHQSLASLNSWYNALRHVAEVSVDNEVPASSADLPFEVLAALEDDLNTPLAFSHFNELAGRIHKASDVAEKLRLASALTTAGAMLGVLRYAPIAWFRSVRAPATGDASDHGLSDEDIEELMTQRLLARKERNFAEADRIRDVLKQNRVALEDHKGGKTSWRRE